jgi:hypothetical protein
MRMTSFSAMSSVGLMAGYYVYNLIDADGVVRYVGKGTGRRVDFHLGMILALAAGAPATRASKVHRRFATDVQIGRQFRAAIVADGLSQADAYAMEARLIAKHRRETEGGTLWNVLAGGEGFQGILRDDWLLVARQAAVTKKLSGSGLRAGAKAAATKALTGSGLHAGAKAAATKLKRLQRPPPGNRP